MATGRVPTTANSPLTAKGDLFGYSTTQARVAVGNDGETLVADSSTSTGLRWQGNYAAGKNKIINGDFGIWQRGTSFTQADTFNADRWRNTFGGAVPTAATISQQSFTPGTAPVAGYEGQFFLRMVTTTIGSCTAAGFEQFIEDVRTFAGQTITVSFWAKADSARTVSLITRQNFGSGGSATTFVEIGTASVTTSWARYSVTYAVPSVSGKTIGTSSYLSTGFRMTTVANGGTLDLWGVQVEAGSIATAFQTATGTIQGELAACQRYYYRVNGGSNLRFGSGQAIGTTLANCLIPFPVQMRTAPTALEQSGTASQYGVLNASASSVLTGGVVPTFDKAGLVNANVTFTVTSGLVAGNAAQCMDNNSSSAYLGWSAEL